MKVLFVNQFYWPDMAATAQQMTDLAELLASQGHDVHVLCSRGTYDDGTGKSTPRREVRKNVHIHRLSAVPGGGKQSMLRRVIDYAGFHVLCMAWLSLFGWGFAIIVTLTTPPLIGIYVTPIRLLSLGRVRHVCWAMDLHPDAEFELGIWSRRNPLWRLMGWLNAFHFRMADATVALGDAMKRRLVGHGVPAAGIEAISVWSGAEEVQPMPADTSPTRHDPRLAGKCVVMYSGNAGLVHTFDSVCRAMLELRDDSRLAFLFVGFGKRLKEIEAFAAEHKLMNFVKLPLQPREQLSESLAGGDVHLVTLREGMSGVAVPCKLYGIMAAARPVVFVGPTDSDTAQHIVQSDCGAVLGIEDSAGLVATFRRLADDHAERHRLGDNARRGFMAHHERQVCCRQWADLLQRVATR